LPTGIKFNFFAINHRPFSSIDGKLGPKGMSRVISNYGPVNWPLALEG